MRILIRILINAVALWVTAQILPGIHIEAGIGALLIVAVIFGLVNAFIRPVIRLLSLPITCLTLGLYTLVINGMMLGLTSFIAGDWMTLQGGFWQQIALGIIGAVIISLISAILGWFVRNDEER